jgi:hypothetical protein
VCVKVKAIIESHHGRRCSRRLSQIYLNQKVVAPKVTTVDEARDLKDYLVSVLVVAFAARYDI